MADVAKEPEDDDPRSLATLPTREPWDDVDQADELEGAGDGEGH